MGELTVATSMVPPPSNLDDLQRLVKMLVASGYFKGVKDMAQGAVKVLAGQEMGFSPIQSLNGIHYVNDRLTYEAALLASALKRRGYTYRGKIGTDSVEIEFFDSSKESIGVSQFSMKDAEKAGLTGKNNWKNYPRNMLWARAMSNGCRWFCPDVFGGPVYTPEELGAEVDESGKPIRAEEVSVVMSEDEQIAELNSKLKEKAAKAKNLPPTPEASPTKKIEPSESENGLNGSEEHHPDFSLELEV